MSFRSENKRNKAVVDAFYQLGIQGRLIDFAQYLDPNFTWTAPNYLPWGGTHTGAAGYLCARSLVDRGAAGDPRRSGSASRAS